MAQPAPARTSRPPTARSATTQGRYAGSGPNGSNPNPNAGYTRTYGAAAAPANNVGDNAFSPNLRRQNFTETDEGYFLDVTTPGFSKSELQLQILHHQRMLTLNGEREGREGETDATLLRSKIARRWRLPLQADAANVSAVLRDGILRVSFAKCDPVANMVTIAIV